MVRAVVSIIVVIGVIVAVGLSLGRIRDIETGPDGLIYLLLEGPAGGLLVRLVPEPSEA